MSRLDGQIAIVTGGAKGIGKGICKVFCEAGATVVLWDMIDEGELTAQELSAAGHRIVFQKVDVTDKDDLSKAVALIMAKFQRIDILINNAGIIRDKSFLKMSEEDWHAVMNVNVNSLFYTCKAVLPHMVKANYGRIVNASSVNGFLGAFGQTNYCASKAAIVGFTKALAKEVGKHGITVNAVAPGFIETEMTASMPEHVIQAGIAQIPVRRIGQPEDMAHTYLYLASKEASFVNGITINANGGAYCH